VRYVAAVLVGALIASGCARRSDEDPATVLGDRSFDAEVDDDLDPIAPATGLSGDDRPSSAQVVKAALADVEAYWGRTYESVYGEPYVPLRGGFWPYGPTTELPPCGWPEPVYEDIADNAFYCAEKDLVAWDDSVLVPRLYEQYGGFTLGIVFAHELAHAVQARALTSGPTIVRELQADSFAGAWTGDVEAGNAPH
jgi:predicted metalloprotease